MPWEQMSFEEALVNRIRSRLKTLDGAVKTSMKMRNRITESVYQLASGYSEEVNKIVEGNPQSKEIDRWAVKFNEFVEQHDLLQERPVE